MLDAALPEQVQVYAQRFAAQIVARQRPVPSLDEAPAVPAVAVAAAASANAPRSPASAPGELDRYQEVDLDSLELVDPRSVGVEHAALSAMRQCGLQDKLSELGLNRPQIAAAVGNIIARMAQRRQRTGHSRLVEGHLGAGWVARLRFPGDGLEPPVPRI